jgi:hypothetical protein
MQAAKVPVRSVVFKEHAMMQCEKEALKRIDDVIAVIHQAIKMRPGTLPTQLCKVPSKQWRTGAGTNPNGNLSKISASHLRGAVQLLVSKLGASPEGV